MDVPAYSNKQVLVFDLDGTLVESKQSPDAEMVELLRALLVHHRVAVISGGSIEQYQKQFVSAFANMGDMEHLILLPTSGAALYMKHADGWQPLYEEKLSPEEVTRITEALQQVITDLTIDTGDGTYGEIIENRGTQVTFSALGQHAPLALKKDWDPDHHKRIAMIARLKDIIPDFEIKSGGTTSIDISRAGIDKAYGIKKLSDALHLPVSTMLFVGDALYPGGNDETAIASGIDCYKVRGVEDTKALIRMFLHA